MDNMSTAKKFERPVHQTIFVDFKTGDVLDVHEISEEESLLPSRSINKRLFLMIAGIVGLVAILGTVVYGYVLQSQVAQQAVTVQFASGEVTSCQASELTACGMSYSQCSDGKVRYCATNVIELGKP